MKTGQCSKLLRIEMISILVSVSESTVSILVQTLQDQVRYDLELANRRRGAMSKMYSSFPFYLLFFYYPCVSSLNVLSHILPQNSTIGCFIPPRMVKVGKDIHKEKKRGDC